MKVSILNKNGFTRNFEVGNMEYALCLWTNVLEIQLYVLNVTKINFMYLYTSNGKDIYSMFVFVDNNSFSAISLSGVSNCDFYYNKDYLMSYPERNNSIKII